MTWSVINAPCSCATQVNEFMAPEEFCHVFAHCDLRRLDNCLAITANCHDVYNMAADMGGMGFIVSNQSGDLE